MSLGVSDLFTAAAQRHQSGRLAEAETLYRQLLELDPSHVEGLHNLGVLAQQTSRYGLAEDLIGRAIALNDEIAQLHLSLAKALRSQGKLDGAVSSIRRAIALQPELAQAHCELSVVLILLGRSEGARASVKRAIELGPDRAESWIQLGDVHQTFGEMDMARAAFLRALELDPRSAVAVHLLSELLSPDKASAENQAVREHVSRLARSLGQIRPAVRDRALFAMSKVLEDQGDYDGAFAAMARANTLVRARLSFDIAKEERRLEAVARVFDKPLLERLKDSGCDSDRPIFIVGMPRSGTTLVEQIISAHPQVFGAGELLNLPQAIAPRGGGSAYPGWARAMRGDDGLALAQAYLASLPPPPSGEVRVTDKMFANFEHLGLIHLFLPNARIIHCRRDPRDACLSCFAARFSQGQSFTFNLIELGRYWRAYDRLMAHWRAVLPPGRMLEVPYEDVVGDVDTWARRLIAHCGLEWDDACLRFYESDRPVHTASLVQVRRPIYASSVGRWRRFAPHLAPLLKALGEPWANEDT